MQPPPPYWNWPKKERGQDGGHRVCGHLFEPAALLYAPSPNSPVRFSRNSFGFDAPPAYAAGKHRSLGHARHARPGHRLHDLFCCVPTLSLTFARSPRPARKRDLYVTPAALVKRAEQYLLSTGLADQAFFGLEGRVFIFDMSNSTSRSNGIAYSDPRKPFTASEMPNLGNKIRHKEGYPRLARRLNKTFARRCVFRFMEELGVKIERQAHHGSRHRRPGPRSILLQHARGPGGGLDDDLQLYVVKKSPERPRQDRLPPKPLAITAAECIDAPKPLERQAASSPARNTAG